ncbi:YczE/YyaS/YitT family protein [Tepidimicrobium xylanilyticum]|uniref:Uncharacterized membrane protein YczE n=1 Tax=Tepidimicrobium xylanilyticum TaxID=1123352 RepID=A0A1H3AR98_9FIRM|nr:hypothetical protein [Tepidimicrobium xylanilyticum]GMG97635.1 membrane protein [Tepidimicrobium xylanilyticum]SDX32163.1 Uncharacterized membrane protein YczE [Tepidimicrobium xylanilyticum]
MNTRTLSLVKSIVKLFIGYFVCATGIVMTINANLGLAPWDVFHQGLSNVLGITIGRAHILAGLTILIISSIFKEKVGWGTVFNMLFIGIFVDFLMLHHLIPTFKSFVLSFIMMLLGMLVLGFGCYLYISVGWGSGPRDGLMIALVKKTKKSVRFIKNFQEIIAVIIGYLLGGSVGIGTVVMAITGGYFMQFAFKVTKFDVNTIQHRFIDDDIKLIKEMLVGHRKCDEKNR